jgi:hypothetical protein
MTQPETLHQAAESVDQAKPIRPAPLPELRLLPALVPLVGFLVLIGLAAVLSAARGHTAADLSLALFALAVGALSLLARPSIAMLLAGCAWLDYDGFVIGRDGSLVWHGTIDAVRAIVLVGVALGALLVRRAWTSGR